MNKKLAYLLLPIGVIIITAVLYFVESEWAPIMLWVIVPISSPFLIISMIRSVKSLDIPQNIIEEPSNEKSRKTIGWIILFTMTALDIYLTFGGKLIDMGPGGVGIGGLAEFVSFILSFFIIIPTIIFMRSER